MYSFVVCNNTSSRGSVQELRQVTADCGDVTSRPTQHIFALQQPGRYCHMYMSSGAAAVFSGSRNRGGGGSYLFKCSCMIRSDMLKHINPWWENIIKNYPAKVTCFFVLKVKTVIFPCKICSTYTKVLRVYFNLLIVYVLSWVLSPLDKYNYVITRTKVRPAAQIRRGSTLFLTLTT